ncbi:uncharacterized protein LOC132546071 [Ylistrum balloti]|uniref:uncharacterized protein LOC132546071 n=1 Tax=Ylistrum balloti TaxID=509963 RepID=UPI002905F378|nr:uncharacterized protein LOC132546071 [Ylistrum balloti]
MEISQFARADLQWWADNVKTAFKPVTRKAYAINITTDSSSYGWGAVLENERTREKVKTGGHWSSDDQADHINVLEFHAAFLAIQCFNNHICGQHGRLNLDNMVAIAVGVEVQSVFQIKKQYDNIKQRAKGKLDELKRPKTGGGPIPKEPSVYEKIFIESHDGRPNIVGLGTCLDTEDEKLESSLTKTVALTLPEADTIAAEGSVTVTLTDAKREEIRRLRKEIEGTNYHHSSSTPKTAKFSSLKRMKRARHDDLEEELLQLEIKRVKMEIELLAMKKEKTRIKIENAKEQQAIIKSQFETIQLYDLHQVS